MESFLTSHRLCCPLIFALLLLNAARVALGDLSIVETWLKENEKINLQKLIEFVSIPSVSADPKRAGEVRRCAEWLVNDLKEAGLENVKLLETKGHPTVYADWLHAEYDGAPTVLIYGHYDVQPEDPIDQWSTPPFEPTVRDGKLYARGASDDKGHMYSPIVAIKAYRKTIEKLPINVKLMLEGEEEVGSPNLNDMIVRNAKSFSTDYAFSADGGMVSPEIPSLNLGLRGSFSLELTLRTATNDMHSGAFGGGVQNPIHALAHLLASFRNITSGKILVPGYYDDVTEVTEEDRQFAREHPIPEQKVLSREGVNETVGEEGYSFYERTWYRPSIEVVGIWGGFTGEGIKTVLPREAHAKIAARIVANQNPKAAGSLLRQYLESEAGKIPGAVLEVKISTFEAEAFKVSKDTPGNRIAAKVLKELYGREPAYQSMGGSIPVMDQLRKILKVDTTMFAFGHNDENVHAPDEYGRIDSYSRGAIGYARLFQELGKEHGQGQNDSGSYAGQDEL